MITKVVKKLWKGEYVSVRDYEVLNAINNGGMCIIHNEETMELTAAQLKDLEPQGESFKSQFNNNKYKLVDIFWKPQ
jgi:hypothetical protein